MLSRQSKIQWTGSTWNPITGCNKISAGCDNCYAERMARRLKAMGVAKYRNGFEVTLHADTLEAPLRLKKPQVIFVNSMSDICHEKVPIDYVRKIFSVMKRADWHIFQLLTKRSGKLVRIDPKLDWPSNVWMGVTVEKQKYRYRIDDLRKIGAAVKFLSLEPLLGPVPELDLTGIDWVIVGGESGPRARPIEQDWVIDIRRQCRSQKVPFFFKQWGGVQKKQTGRILQGRIYSETPPMPQLEMFSG